MGFNLYSLGNIHTCWIENHKVYYESTATKIVYSYDTALDVTLPKQLNLFVSDNVAFLMFDDNNKYIGRYDGVISIYRKSDDMLVGLSNWKPPTYPPLKSCGFYTTPVQPDEVMLDLRDKQTVYVRWHNIEAKVKVPIDLKFDEPMGIISYEAFANEGPWHIYNERGEPVEVDVWFIQKELWRRDCTILL